MSNKQLLRPPVAVLEEYQQYIEELRVPWLAKNRSRSRDVYEVMSEQDRAEVHNIIVRWGIYITPFAEAWWKERGYGIVWPDDNTKPEQYYRLQAA